MIEPSSSTISTTNDSACHSHLRQHPPLIESSSSINTTNSNSSSVTNPSSRPSHVRRPNWTTTEDEQLCRSWLENSFDPVTHAIQKGTQFWHRVAEDFASRGPGHIERNKDHVRNRWQLLQAKVIKFTSCYERIQSLLSSDKSHDEIVSEALRLYEREESHKFTFYSSWLILRNSSRWIQWSSNAGQKRTSSCLQPISDIAVSPHSTVSLLDSDESQTIDQPLNRLISTGICNLSSGRMSLDGSSSTGCPLNGIKNENSISVHRHNSHPDFPSPSSAPPTHNAHHSHPQSHRRYRSHYKKSMNETEDESVDRLMAMAMKRKADVQEAALEVQLLAIDPEKITDPLRKEVYMMKMEEIRDRYKAKRNKSSEVEPDLSQPNHDERTQIHHANQSHLATHDLGNMANHDDEFALTRSAIQNDLSVPFDPSS